MRGSQPGVACPLPGARWLHSKSDWFDCPSDWSTNCGYLCMYNFIMPACSFQFAFWLSTHVTCCCHSLVYTAGTSCLEIPSWQVCQSSICSSTLLTLFEWFVRWEASGCCFQNLFKTHIAIFSFHLAFSPSISLKSR